MKLTDNERATLNEAMAIIGRHTEGKAQWSMWASLTGCTVSYFDSRDLDANLRAHHHITGETFADKVQAVLDIEAALPTPEETRAARLKKLREEMAKLENAA